jgi:hypothetical protein
MVEDRVIERKLILNPQYSIHDLEAVDAFANRLLPSLRS